MAIPSAGSQPALRLHFVPGPRIPCPSLEPLPGPSPGLVWGDRGPDRPGCGCGRTGAAGGAGQAGESSVFHFVQWTHTFQIFVPKVCGPRFVLNLVRKCQGTGGSHLLHRTRTRCPATAHAEAAARRA